MEGNGLFSLGDKVAVVTGGGRSLGLEISRTLRGAGAEVVVAEEDTGFLALSTFTLADGALTASPDVGTIRYDGGDPVGPDVATVDVDGDGDDDVVAVGIISPGDRGRAIVAVAEAGTFTSSRWAVWGESLDRDPDTGRLQILEDARW